jgi:tetratricopeptide (TPR) repeat protein
VASAQTPAAPVPSSTRKAAEPYKQRGDALAREGKLDLAVREYRAALSIDSTYSEVYNALGTVHVARRELSLAITQYRLALSQTADFPEARYNLAFALRKAGRFPEAVREYQRYVTIRAQDPDGHYGHAETLKAQGDRAGAKAAFERYLALEKRPSEAAWVARAKAEIAALEKLGIPSSAPAGAQGLTRATASAAVVSLSPTPSSAAGSSPPTLAPAKRLSAQGATTPVTTPDSQASKPASAAAVASSPSPKPAPASAISPPSAPASATPAVRSPRERAVAAVSTPVARPEVKRSLSVAVPRTAQKNAPSPAFVKGRGVLVPLALVSGKEKAGDAEALVRQGEAAFRLRDFERARARFEAAAKAAPHRADVFHRLAASRAACGDLKAAIAAWDEVVRLNPAHLRAREFAMRAREKLGLIAPISVDSKGGEKNASLAEMPAAAARRYARAFAKSGRAADLMAHARVLMEGGRYERAIRALLEVAALETAAPLPYYHLAACHRRLGDEERGAYFARLYLRAADATDSSVAPFIAAARRWAKVNR